MKVYRTTTDYRTTTGALIREDCLARANSPEEAKRVSVEVFTARGHLDVRARYARRATASDHEASGAGYISRTVRGRVIEIGARGDDDGPIGPRVSNSSEHV